MVERWLRDGCLITSLVSFDLFWIYALVIVQMTRANITDCIFSVCSRIGLQILRIEFHQLVKHLSYSHTLLPIELLHQTLNSQP
jgi:hypothetical protein